MKKRKVRVVLEIETDMPLPALKRKAWWQSYMDWQFDVKQVKVTVVKKPAKEFKENTQCD